jgi:hypothetical protein
MYWLGHRDSTGSYLDGAGTYRLSVPQPMPVRLFWSVTFYDAETRSQIQTDQNKAVLSSLFGIADNARDTVELHFGPCAPPGRRSSLDQDDARTRPVRVHAPVRTRRRPVHRRLPSRRLRAARLTERRSRSPAGD